MGERELESRDRCRCRCRVKIDHARSEHCAIHRFPRDPLNNPGTQDSLRVVFNVTANCPVRNIIVWIVDDQNQFVVMHTLPGQLGRIVFNWDLRNQGLRVVKQGCYLIYINAATECEMMCSDFYRVHVLECGEIQRRNANQGRMLDAIACNSTMSSRDRLRALFLADYRDMIHGVRQCICEKLAADLESGSPVNWENPCFISCITAGIAHGLEPEFEARKGSVKGGSVWEAAELASMTAHHLTYIAWATHPTFIFDILYIENIIRGKAMANCGSCTFTANDKNAIIDCILNVTPGWTPSSFISWQLDISADVCKRQPPPPPGCNIPKLR